MDGKAKLLLLVFVLILFGSVVQAQVIFQDNFNDGSITDWDVNSGIWSAANLDLNGPGSDNQSISHTVTMPNDGRSKRIYYKMKISSASAEGEFAYFTDQNGVYNSAGNTNINGYVVRMTNANITLQRFIAGTITNLIVGTNPSGASVYVDINVSHGFDGNVQLWINGTSAGSTIDTTYQSGSRIIYGTNAGPTITVDDVNILYTGDTNSQFRIVNEENAAGLPGATLTINGSSWPVGSTGSFDVNSSITFPATLVIGHVGFDTRTFSFDTNAGLYMNRLFGLRDATEAKDIEFQFFAPDEITILPNRWISVIRTTNMTPILSGRAKTNSEGMVTFNLAPQDGAYDFNIFALGTDFGDNNIQYTYGSVSVTVNAPRNEATNNAIVSPSGFTVDVGGLGLQNDACPSSFPCTNIVILGNTIDVYSLRVADENSDGQQFFARNYSMHAKGDIDSITIQPYLIDIDEGVLVNLLVVDAPTNTSVPDVRVTISTGINNALVVVEDTTTDSTGIAQLVMLSQKQYVLNITSPNQDINYLSGTISAASTTPTFFINFTSSDQNFTTRTITVSFFPKTDTVSGVSQKFDVNVGVDFNFSSFLVQAIDNNRVVASTASGNNPFNASLTVQLADFNSSQVIIRVTVITADQNSVINKTYTITSIGSGGLLNLIGLRDDSSPNNMIIFAVIGLIGLAVVMGPGIAGNNDAQVFVGAVGLGLISFLLFREFFVFIIGAVFAGAIAWLWVRTPR